MAREIEEDSKTNSGMSEYSPTIQEELKLLLASKIGILPIVIPGRGTVDLGRRIGGWTE